jgi:hypothetical protein
MGQTKNDYKILVKNLKVTDHSEELGVAGRITLEFS